MSLPCGTRRSMARDSELNVAKVAATEMGTGLYATADAGFRGLGARIQ